MTSPLNRRRKAPERRSKPRWLEHASHSARSHSALSHSARSHSGWVLGLLVCCTSRPDGTGLFQAVGSPSFGDPLAPAAGIDSSPSVEPGSPGVSSAGGSEGQALVGIEPAGIGSGVGGGAGSTEPPLTDVDVDVDVVEAFDAGGEDAATLDARAPPPTCFPEPELCDGLDGDCDGNVDGPTCAAGCTGIALDGRGYMFCASAVSRAAALERCAQEGMRLVWLETAVESEALLDAIAATNPSLANNPELLTQIGASDGVVEGAWRWVGNRVAPDAFSFWQGGPGNLGGEALGGAYAGWAAGEPNNSPDEDCATISIIGGPLHPPGSWDDRACGATELFPFACEAP